MHRRLPKARRPGRRDSECEDAEHDRHGHAVGGEVKGKEYVRPIPPNWWLRKRSYTLFMIRELTAVFVGGYAVFLLFLLFRASQGTVQFHQFVLILYSMPSVLLHAAPL